MITFMDKQVGRLMTLLDDLGLSDNTIILFTSDNGTTMLKAQVDYEFFESVGPLRGLKGQLYEGGIRVPLVVRWPGRVQAGSVTDLPAVQYDMMATLAAIAGATPAADTDGVSILPTLLGKPGEQASRDYLFWDFAGYGGQLAVRSGDWKGIKTGLKKDPDAPLELYNLAADIGEQNNVAAENPEIAAKMEKIMLKARTAPDEERFRFGVYPE
jgi:arylsulfatase A-like enzyme